MWEHRAAWGSQLEGVSFPATLASPPHPLPSVAACPAPPPGTQKHLTSQRQKGGRNTAKPRQDQVLRLWSRPLGSRL